MRRKININAQRTWPLFYDFCLHVVVLALAAGFGAGWLWVAVQVMKWLFGVVPTEHFE